MSYNEFCEKSDPKKKDKNNLIPINFNFNKNAKVENLDNEQEKNIFYNKLINELLGEEEVPKIKIAHLIELFQYQKENENNEKNFLDVLVEKNKTSLKFQNLKNLEL